MKTFCLIVILSMLISVGFDFLGSMLWVMKVKRQQMKLWEKEHRGDKE